VAARHPLPAAGLFPASERLKPYVPRLAVDWMREEPELRHRQVDASLAFVDISGFTSLTERLSKKGKVGAEEMNDLLDSTFTELLSAAYDFGAGVIKWGGDATLLLFTGDDHPARACRAAVEMQRKMRAVGRLKTSAGLVTLRMSIGIHSGFFDFFYVGSLHREVVLAGPAATITVETEAVAESGEIVISGATAAALEPTLVGSERGAGFLLRRGPAVEAERTPPLGDVSDIDLVRCVPVAISSHLLEGGGEAEHRPLTIAFIHFGGTDELLAARGPDALADALDHCLDTVEGIALEYKVAFFDTDIAAGGGKIMLVSGAPTSSGNDEERMLRTLRSIADSQTALPLRIGVHHGRIIAADFGPPYRRTYSFKGDAANLAARLMAKAAVGQILVTADVLAKSRTEFDAEPLEPFTVKGKAEPVQAYALGAVAGTRARRAESPLVGRDNELRTLLDAVKSARRYEGRIVEIVGDPGIGKSRLIQELEQDVRPDGFVSVQCDEYEATTPYHAFDGLLRSVLAPTGASHGALTTEHLRLLVERAAPHLLPWLPLLGVPLGLELPDTPETEPLEGEFRKQRLQEVVGELLGMHLLQPTVIVFEDVHWLDEASADLLAYIALTLEARPWLVVVTRRDRPTTFSVSDDANPLQIWLEPLSADASAELIDRSVHELPLTQQQAADLATKAGGNPLFLTELLAVAHRADGLEALPDSVEALMIREIDRLSPPARRMLRSAAVVGATFGLDLLKTCLDEPWDDETWSSLDEFVLAQDDGTFRFRHMLARDAAYEGLPYRRRRELHARVGETLETHAGPAAEEEAGLLSLHFFHAHRFGEAWRYSRAAGSRAQVIYANVDAAVFFERALAAGRHLDTVSKGDLAAVAEALGDVRDRAGDFRRAEAAYREARRLHEGDSVDEARLLLKHAWIPERLGRYSQALRWIRRAQRLLEGDPGEPAARQRAQLHAWHANINIYQGRFGEAIAWCRRAVDEAERSGEKDALALTYQLLDWAYVALGQPEQATYSRRALVLYEELGDLRGQAAVYNNLGMWAYFQGDWSEALELYARARDIRERMGDPIHAAVANENIAEILIDQEHLEQAEPLLQSALRVCRASGWRAETATATKLLGKLRSRSGRFDEALELLEAARSEYRDVGAQSGLNETEAWMAECHLLREDSEAALALSTEALARAEASGGFEVASLKRVRAYALLMLGRRSAAKAALEDSLQASRARQVDYEIALSIDGLVHLDELEGARRAEALEAERDAILERLEVGSPRPARLYFG
jgi:predicted ATPase/class 3 adenylate cyclase